MRSHDYNQARKLGREAGNNENYTANPYQNAALARVFNRAQIAAEIKAGFPMGRVYKGRRGRKAS